MNCDKMLYICIGKSRNEFIIDQNLMDLSAFCPIFTPVVQIQWTLNTLLLFARWHTIMQTIFLQVRIFQLLQFNTDTEQTFQQRFVLSKCFWLTYYLSYINKPQRKQHIWTCSVHMVQTKQRPVYSRWNSMLFNYFLQPPDVSIKTEQCRWTKHQNKQTKQST